MVLAVIDYGAGNLRSVLHALDYLGAGSIRVARTPQDLRGASQIILPGVGAFAAGMNQLREQHLIAPIREAAHAGIPLLGICLGMQFLFETSDEMGDYEGLGLLEGRVTRFPDLGSLKVPHMGWNTLQFTHPCPLLNDIPPESYAYFVHSYHCIPAQRSDALITTCYGIDFVAGIQRNNIYGVQFHPEKSQRTGLQLLANFLEIAA